MKPSRTKLGAIAAFLLALVPTSSLPSHGPGAAAPDDPTSVIDRLPEIRKALRDQDMRQPKDTRPQSRLAQWCNYCWQNWGNWGNWANFWVNY